jgi:hypothetical protein
MLELGMVLIVVGCVGMGWVIQQLTTRVAQLEWHLATPCRTCHPTVPQFPPAADPCTAVGLPREEGIPHEHC